MADRLHEAEEVLGKLPFGSQIVAGIKALRELRGGNPREALVAAIDAVPSGPIKEGMKTATNLGFAPRSSDRCPARALDMRATSAGLCAS